MATVGWLIVAVTVSVFVILCSDGAGGRTVRGAVGGIDKTTGQDLRSRNHVTTILAGLSPSSLTTCGKRPSYQSPKSRHSSKLARVVAGMASANRWPWQVALLDKHSKEPFCGGTLIARDHVLTAAHCFDNKNQNDILVVLGEHDRSRNEGTEQTFPVHCVHVHRRYISGEPFNNDIAIIRLKTSPGHDVIINDFVQPACIPETKNEFKAGDFCYVTGWGYTGFSDLLMGLKPTKLNEARLPLLSRRDCQQAYGASISKKMICAGYLEGEQRADTCKGDSGGPLVCQSGGVWKIYGVTSWGYNSFCNPSPVDSVPGVYTRVDRYRTWIQSTLDKTECS